MTEHRIAQTTPAPTTDLGDQSTEKQSLPGYVLRGLGILTISGEEILASYMGGGKFVVPSGTNPDHAYEVRVGTHPDRDRCECKGWKHHGHCSHLIAASRVAKASALCDCCGTRRWDHDLVEVTDDDGLLSWYEGDRLCGSCVRSGAWA